MKMKLRNATPLALALSEGFRPHATPLGVFKLARKRYLEGKHIGLGELARDVGISRGTLQRWVGSKELLIEEIHWSLVQTAFEKAVQETPVAGIEHVIGVHRHFMTAILNFRPLEQFVKNEPHNAFRILTDTASGLNQRIVQLIAAHLSEQQALGHLPLHAPALELAEFFVLANRALIFSDRVSGRCPDIEKACALIRRLLVPSATI